MGGSIALWLISVAVWSVTAGMAVSSLGNKSFDWRSSEFIVGLFVGASVALGAVWVMHG